MSIIRQPPRDGKDFLPPQPPLPALLNVRGNAQSLLPPGPYGLGYLAESESPRAPCPGSEGVTGNLAGTGHLEKTARLDTQELGRPCRINKWVDIQFNVHRSPPQIPQSDLGISSVFE